MLSLAYLAREITAEFGAQLIINDHIEIANKVGADGIHLGQCDRTTKEARSILGEDAIIGRTCNTLKEIIEACENRIDYVGVGPLRFTSTKEVLSPSIGFEGFKEMVIGLEKAGITVPIIAIGGIKIDDFEELKKCGVHGVAIASLINGAVDIGIQSEKVLSALDKW
jgi:thiamine-phosphate pyrophosphorylase